MSKHVLITGGAGFIAHHVIAHILKHTDWTITSLDRLDFSGNLNRLADLLQDQPVSVRQRVSVVYHDLRAAISPLTASMVGKPDIILHLAAGSHVDRSIEFPLEFVQDNVVGTANLLDWARTQDYLERFVYFSTDEVFGPAPAGVKYSERDRYNSTNPYSATKAGAEELCVAFENTYKLPVYITHCMNIFGERQHPEKFIPMCIRKIRAGETIDIHASSDLVTPGSRHYIHAADVADGLMHILSLVGNFEPDYGGARCPKFNLVGAEEINNLALAQLIAQAQKAELKYRLVDFHSSRPGHDLRYALSGDYLRGLGWEPRVKLSERIQQVVAWSLANDRWLKT